MASYRPKIKIDSAGNTKDLPLDAETLKGKNIDYFATSKALTDLQNTVNGKQDKLNTNQLNAVNSGITQAKVTKYDGYEKLISSKPSVDNVYTKDEVNNVLAKLTRLKSNVDNRNVNTKPNDYNGWFDIKGLKNNTVINIPSGNTDYSAVLGLRGWIESSGGDAHELAFTGNGNIYHRYGATTSWNEWEKLATNKDLENKLDKDGTAVKANGIVDYAASENTIEIGYNGDTATTAEYFAVYQRNGSKIKIKDMSITNVKKVLGINSHVEPKLIWSGKSQYPTINFEGNRFCLVYYTIPTQTSAEFYQLVYIKTDNTTTQAVASLGSSAAMFLKFEHDKTYISASIQSLLRDKQGTVSLGYTSDEIYITKIYQLT